MTTRISAMISRTLILCLLALATTLWGAAQEPEKPVSTDLPAPVLSPEPPAPPAAKATTLSLVDRADIFMARKSYSDAVDYYRRVLSGPGRTDAPVWNKLGIAYQQMMNYASARKAYKESIRNDANFSEPWNNLGTTFYLDNKAKKSVKYYRQAIKLNPNSASYHMNLGTTFYQLKKYKESLEEYRTALSLNPNVLTERSALGTVMQARTADAKFFFYMAKVFASLGRADEAVRYLRRALEDGFNDQKAMDSDPDLKKIAEFPDYVELRKNPPKAIKE